jgi:hypothetical protein
MSLLVHIAEPEFLLCTQHNGRPLVLTSYEFGTKF